MGGKIRLDAGTAQIYALDLRVLSNLEAKWFEDMRNSPRRAGPSFHPYMLHMHYDVKDSKSKSVLPKMLARFGLVGKILVAPFGSFQVKFPMDWKDANMVEFIYLKGQEGVKLK